jgi:lipoprotein-anchoring transpeptidase ErfK/SrfK
VKSDKGNNIGFHSIPQKPDGTLEGKLGTPVSHGCVRLAKAKAKFLYNWAPNGTRVVVKK